MMRYSTKGISLIAVIIVMLVVSTLAWVVASALSGGNIASVTDMQEEQAFYLAQAGLQWYIGQLKGDSDWSSPPPVKTDQPFGAGTFSVTYSNEAEDSIDVTATGKVTGWDGNPVQRSITQHVEKSLSEGTVFSNFAIFCGGGDGNITSDIKNNQTITGDIFVNGSLDIAKNCTITGDVSATGAIDVGSGTEISGTISEYADPPANQPVLDTTYYDNLITLASGQPSGNREFEAETLSGAVYVNGDVKIEDYIDGSGTIVATGEIEIKKNTDIGGNIMLVASGDLTMKENGTVGKNVTFYSSSKIDLKRGIVLGSGAGAGEGVVLLSPGDVELSRNITLVGFIFGDDIEIGRNLTFTGNISGNRLIELSRGGVITRDDTKVDYNSIEGFDSGANIAIITSLWREEL